MMDGSRRVAENGESLGGCSNPYVSRISIYGKS